MREREALKLALATLQDYVDEYGPWKDDCGVRYVLRLCKKALAQPEIESVDSDEIASAYMADQLGEFVQTAGAFPKAKVDSRLWNQVMVFAPKQSEPVAIHQFRSLHCANWYDGIPDHHDGHGPYEVRTLYTTPPQSKPLTDEQLIAAYDSEQQGRYGDHIRSLRAIEAAHNIKE
jgi:hypothetical protein